MFYDNGKGVPQNHTKAHMWYNIAAANGYEDASKGRDEIAEKLTSAAIERPSLWLLPAWRVATRIVVGEVTAFKPHSGLSRAIQAGDWGII